MPFPASKKSTRFDVKFPNAVQLEGILRHQLALGDLSDVVIPSIASQFATKQVARDNIEALVTLQLANLYKQDKLSWYQHNIIEQQEIHRIIANVLDTAGQTVEVEVD